MTRSISRVLRVCLTLAVLGSCLLVGTAGTAAASSATGTTSWTQSFPIKFGTNGVQVGTGTVTRTDGEPLDTIVVTYSIDGRGYTESQLCVSSSPFTSKIPPGSCKYKDVVGGTSGSYSFTVGATEVIYLQLHITTRDNNETAYLGWVQDSPAYGNVHVPNPVRCPAGFEPPAGGVLVDVEVPMGVAENCVFTPVPADCPTGMVPDGDAVPTDRTGDNEADNCVAAQVPVRCPAGFEPPAGGVLVDVEAPMGVAENCVFTPVPADCPTGMVPDGDEVPADRTGDGVADNCVAAQVEVSCPIGEVMVEGACEKVVIPPTNPGNTVIDLPATVPPTCPDGTVMTDVDGNGVIDAADCAEVLSGGEVPAPSRPSPAIPARPAVPGEPTIPATPATPPAPPAPTVLPSTVTPDVVPVVAPVTAPTPAQVESAVLGAHVQRAPLARTGSSSTGLAAFGVLLLALGATSTLLGRRTVRA